MQGTGATWPPWKGAPLLDERRDVTVVYIWRYIWSFYSWCARYGCQPGSTCYTPTLAIKKEVQLSRVQHLCSTSVSAASLWMWTTTGKYMKQNLIASVLHSSLRTMIVWTVQSGCRDHRSLRKEVSCFWCWAERNKKRRRRKRGRKKMKWEPRVRVWPVHPPVQTAF